MEPLLHVKVHRSGHLYVSAAVFNRYRVLTNTSRDSFWLTREMEVSKDGIKENKIHITWDHPVVPAREYTLQKGYSLLAGYEPGSSFLCNVTQKGITIHTGVWKSRQPRLPQRVFTPNKDLYQEFKSQVQDAVVVRLRDHCPNIPVSMLGKEFPTMTLGELLRAASKDR